MKILIVDDVAEMRTLLSLQLKRAGYQDILAAGSAAQALEWMGASGASEPCADVDLILMDLNMPGIDGLEACRRFKRIDRFQDVPIIVVTAESSPAELSRAFEAGASDFIAKPVVPVVLLARVRSALRLKQEMDRRKGRERQLLDMHHQLEAMNRRLQELASRDGLTGLANRREFDQRLALEWKRTVRSGGPLTLILLDVDCFKAYNDHYGHLQGDECLKQVGGVLAGSMLRGTDLVARYGGEEFVALAPGAGAAQARMLAERLRDAVYSLNVPHLRSPFGRASVSVGAATTCPSRDGTSLYLLQAADEALYAAKQEGRNRVVDVYVEPRAVDGANDTRAMLHEIG